MGLETRQQLERVDIGPSIASDTTVTETQDLLEDILADDAAEAAVKRTAGGSRKSKSDKKW